MKFEIRIDGQALYTVDNRVIYKPFFSRTAILQMEEIVRNMVEDIKQEPEIQVAVLHPYEIFLIQPASIQPSDIQEYEYIEFIKLLKSKGNKFGAGALYNQ